MGRGMKRHSRLQLTLSSYYLVCWLLPLIPVPESRGRWIPVEFEASPAYPASQSYIKLQKLLQKTETKI